MYCYEPATAALIYITYERYDYRRHVGGNRVVRLSVCAQCEGGERFLKLQRETFGSSVERIVEKV